MIKISTSFSGVVSTGSYETERPFFAIEEDVEYPLTDEQKAQRLLDLHNLCKQAFEVVERESNAKRIKKAYANIRFREKNGKQYPSVTPILNWDEEFYVSPDELTQYASQGEIIHLKAEHLAKTGEWVEAKQIPEAHKHILILSKGSLGLDPNAGNLKAFFEKYPFEFLLTETEVFNDEFLYSGRFDVIGKPKMNKEWEKTGATDELCLLDYKRTANPIKNFQQLSAYANGVSLDIKQLIVVPVNDKTQQGFSQPKITHDIDSYFKMFLQARKISKKNLESNNHKGAIMPRHSSEPKLT